MPSSCARRWRRKLPPEQTVDSLRYQELLVRLLLAFQINIHLQCLLHAHRQLLFLIARVFALNACWSGPFYNSGHVEQPPTPRRRLRQGASPADSTSVRPGRATPHKASAGPALPCAPARAAAQGPPRRAGSVPLRRSRKRGKARSASGGVSSCSQNGQSRHPAAAPRPLAAANWQTSLPGCCAPAGRRARCPCRWRQTAAHSCH